MASTQLEGDGQADLKNHGGVDKAVLAYSAHHYDSWGSHLNLPDLPYGAFGENSTIVGQTEAEVCIGDTYVIGGARIQMSQPRQPCWKLSRRWRIADLAQQVVANGRSGWYFRVLQEGQVAPAQAIQLCDRPYPEWTIARAHQIMHHDNGSDHLYEVFNGELVEVPAESGYNTSIAFFLAIQFANLVGHLRVRPHGLELEVRGEPKNRYPDLTIIRPEHVALLPPAIPYACRYHHRC